jgi:hypothetical protein
MFKVFLYGLYQTFLVSFGVTLIAALASVLRPSHSPRETTVLAQAV